jgi:hypothetical protein
LKRGVTKQLTLDFGIGIHVWCCHLFVFHYFAIQFSASNPEFAGAPQPHFWLHLPSGNIAWHWKLFFLHDFPI